MRQIRIFLASSIDEFKIERLEFERFIRVLDKIFSKQNIHIDLVVCEDMSKALSNSSKQQDINEEIPSCQYFYVIIGKEAGIKTVEEFKVALESRNTTGKPKIYTYFYNLDEQNQTESVREFIRYIADDLKHYFSLFMNIDTVKLDFLMELCMDYAMDAQLCFENGEAVFQGESVLPLKNIPIYERNKDLSELSKKKEILNTRFSKLCAEYALNPSNKKTYGELLTVSEERTHVLDQLRELEKNVLLLYKDVTAYNSNNSELTWYEIEAKKQVEQGNYAGAIAILRDEQRKKDLEEAVLLTDTGLTRIESHIRENELLIKTLKAQKRTDEIVDEIDNIYSESVALTQKYGLKNNILYDYACFLVNSKEDYERILCITNDILEKSHEEDFELLADIYQLIGKTYLNNAHKLADGEKYYLKSTVAYEQIEDSAKKYQNIIFNYSRLYAIYGIEGNRCYDKRHEICETLLEINNNNKKSKLISSWYKGIIYGVLCDFYLSYGIYKSVEKSQEYAELDFELAKNEGNHDWLSRCYSHLEKIYKIQKHQGKALDMALAKYNERKKEFEADNYGIGRLAIAAKELGKHLYDLHRYQEAIPYTKESLEMYKKLVERNPLGYEFGLTNCLHNMGLQYEAVYDYFNAEKAYREAYIRRKETLGRDDVYEHEVICSCRALAYVLTVLNRFNEAEELYREALKISIDYAHKDNSKQEYIRTSKSQLARNCLCPLHKFSECEEIIIELIEFARANTPDNNNANDKLAEYLDDYATMLCGMHNPEKAIGVKEESLSIYETYKDDSEKRLTYSIHLHNMAWVLMEAGKYEESFPFLEKESEIREELIAEKKEGMDLYMASTYYQYGEYYSFMKKYENAENYYNKALTICKSMYDICEEAFSNDLAKVYLSYAKLMVKVHQKSSAEKFCKEAIELYTKLEAKEPIVYGDELTDAYETFVRVRTMKN